MAKLPKIKHIHILAISGQGMTTPLAINLKKNGFHVTGSDQPKIFPPASVQLKKASISVNTTTINQKIDLCIIGSSYNKFNNTRNEFALIKKLKIPYISATSYIAQNIIKHNSIIVAGSYGKTTTTGLLTWILLKAKYNPNYLIGGKLINKIPSINTSSSDWSIVEGDESINGLDTKAKFLYFNTKYVILTSVYWEHKESYSTKAKNLKAYKELIKNIPKDGILVYNQHDLDLKVLTKYCKGQAIPYTNDLVFKTPLIGDHNHQNISLAYTLSKALGIKDNIIREAISSYQGIARRLQLLGSHKKRIFFDDFAQSPPRIYSSINAIKKQYPSSHIKVFFEPHASFLQNHKSISLLKKSFQGAHMVVLSQIPYQKINPQSTRISFKDFKTSIGPKTKYLPLYEDLVDFFIKSLSPNDILIHMSSGGQLGLKAFTKIINNFKN